MTQSWKSVRHPPPVHLAFFFAGYVLAAGFAQWLAINPGTGISVWPPSGLFIAALLLTDRGGMAAWLATGLAAELCANWLWFHNPLLVACLLYAGNALCAVTGAWLIARFGGSSNLESLRDVLCLVLFGALIAPIVAATVGAATLSWHENQPFLQAWRLWWIGDATGVLIVAPLILVGAQGWLNRASVTVERVGEAGLVGLALVGAATLSLSGHLPFAYIVMPPLLWAAVRFEFKGAVVTVVTLALLAAVFTVQGVSPFSGDTASQLDRSVMLQLFLAISALSALIVAAVAQQHRLIRAALQTSLEELERRVEERTRALRESEHRLKTLADHSPDIFSRFDRDMRHVFVSAAVERATGRRAADFVGKTNREIGMPPARCVEWEQALLAVFDTGLPKALSFHINGPEGLRYYEGRLVPELDADGNVEHVLAITTDSTERELARREIQEADRRKTEFLAVLAHELRNPLAAVRGAVHLLSRKELEPARIQRAVQIIDRQSNVMTRLVNDLMDANRIGRGSVDLNLEPVQLKHVLDSAVETSRPLVEEAGHSLTWSLPDQPVIVSADRLRLAQVFSNLLNNAAKYSDPGGQIDIKVGLSDKEAVVAVADRGIGIPHDKLATLFEMFSQVESALSRSRGGLGIGLSVVKQLVELHGGRVEAHSDGLGNGSTFLVYLPVSQEVKTVTHETEDGSDGSRAGNSASNGAGNSEGNSASPKFRVLIVDDNKDGAASLGEILVSMGHTVDIANRGRQAVEMAAEWLPDVVLCDVGLPDLDGYSVCRSIRTLPGGADIHLIAVTGWHHDDYRQQSADAGFDRHLVKPIDPKALVETLSSFRIRHDPQRLAELRRCMILDSSSERDFDAITAAVVSSLDVPIAMVNLLDARRDWFKACVGLTASESPAATSFCETMLDSSEDTVVIEDTTHAPRFQNHPLVVGEPHIRFYAATRLVVNGHVLGTLCAYDVRPRQISPRQIEELSLMATAVVELLQRRSMGHERLAEHGTRV